MNSEVPDCATMSAMEDRYEILDVIARGAMATVWRARDVRLDRVVAIKRPHPTPNAGTTDAGFAAAARSAAGVTHPNLITIFDTGTDATGPYLVMEFVDGPSLVEMGGASGGAAALGSEVSSGLSALHAAGIVHRDVRPSNILLGPTGAKLTDFGTARSIDAGTRSSVAAPRFEAPEVLAGGEPDGAADVYSLGAVLSWLAGQSAADPQLSSIIEQAMSEEPKARPTAATLAERLHKIAPTSVAAVRPSPTVAAAPQSADETRQYHGPLASSETPDSDQPSPRRRRRLVAWIAAILLALIVAVVAFPGDEDPVPVASDTTIVATTDGDATATTSGSGEASVPETTVAEESGGVFNTVRIFVTFIRETPRDVLTNSGAEEIISDVADGVSEAIRGNDDEAESSLGSAVETVQEEIESESIIDRAIELITRLARQLGLDVERVVEPSE